MSLTSFKKNLSRVNQKLNEKVAGYKGTSKGEEYKSMTDQMDLYKKHFEEISSKTVEVLQPNPAIRAKMGAVNTFTKLQGRSSSSVYPQAEAELAEVMNKYGNSFGSTSVYGAALLDAGASFLDLAELKYANEDDIRERFLGPIHNIINQDIKEISALRKKCEMKRLDYDTERKNCEKGQNSDPNSLNEAQSRYKQSLEASSAAMDTFLKSDGDHIAHLSEMVESMREYHRRSAEILETLTQNLEKHKRESSENPRQSFGFAFNTSPVMPRSSLGPPSCRALYAFKAENANELEFDEGDVINLIEQVDANWFLGRFKNKVGHFPVNYVEVINPLPSS